MEKRKSIETLSKLENQFKDEEVIHPHSYIILQGCNSVCVSAPHSVTHWRNEQEKTGEYMTGALATFLHEVAGCHVMMKTKFEKNDANFDEFHPYKAELIRFIKHENIQLLLDLHIMADFREPEIEIGTGSGRNVQQNGELALVLKESFEKVGVQPVIIDEHFTGGYAHTVSSTIARETGIPCLQIEVNWRLLNLESEQNKALQVLQVLQEYISFIETGEIRD